MRFRCVLVRISSPSVNFVLSKSSSSLVETVYPLDKTDRGLKACNFDEKLSKEIFLLKRTLLNTFLKIKFLLFKSAF